MNSPGGVGGVHRVAALHIHGRRRGVGRRRLDGLPRPIAPGRGRLHLAGVRGLGGGCPVHREHRHGPCVRPSVRGGGGPARVGGCARGRRGLLRTWRVAAHAGRSPRDLPRLCSRAACRAQGRRGGRVVGVRLPPRGKASPGVLSFDRALLEKPVSLQKVEELARQPKRAADELRAARRSMERIEKRLGALLPAEEME